MKNAEREPIFSARPRDDMFVAANGEMFPAVKGPAPAA